MRSLESEAHDKVLDKIIRIELELGDVGCCPFNTIGFRFQLFPDCGQHFQMFTFSLRTTRRLAKSLKICVSMCEKSCVNTTRDLNKHVGAGFCNRVTLCLLF